MRCKTVIIGAGPAGLATAACLTRRGKSFVLLEEGSEVAASWRRHYDRLHLHTPRHHSSLPYLPMPAAYPTYPARQQVVDYLEGYAKHFGLEPRFGAKVHEIMKADGGWRVTMAKESFIGRTVVVCTGFNRVPVTPRWPGSETFAGNVLHSSSYTNGKPFAGKRVLVVGAGNSGAEIALDLLEHGAEPSISIRGPIHVVGRDVGPVPALDIAIAMEGMPDWFRNAVMRAASLARYGDLRPWGIRRPAVGMLDQIRRGRIPLIDVGTIAAIKRRQIKVCPGIAAFSSRTVRFVDGDEREFEAVVLATGYRTSLPDLIPSLSSLFDARGLPRSVPCLAEAPGLYFVGFENPPTGFLRAIRRRAEQVVALMGSAASRTPE